jgi:N-acyl-D-amino-acid deacylase
VGELVMLTHTYQQRCGQQLSASILKVGELVMLTPTRRTVQFVARVFIGLLVLTGSASGTVGQQFDVVIQGGHILDGSGNPWYRADIGIVGDRIVAIGRLDSARATRIVDARGRTVTPGFIDLHSHADGPEYGNTGLRSDNPARRAAPNLVAQGITTVVVNHDGRSPWPIGEQRDALLRKGTGPNVAVLIGHGTIRRMVMGDDFRRNATDTEVDSMRALVSTGMREGAFGLSSGLEYVPGRWSDTREVKALVAELAPYEGVYVTHERSSGADPMWYLPSEPAPTTTFLDAVAETIEIAEETGVTSVQTHVKARGANYWGSSHAAIQMIDRARARGVRIWADQYPYSTTGSDGNTVLIPGWALRTDRGGTPADRVRRLLADSTLSRRLRTDVAHEIRRRGDAEKIVVLEYPDPAYVGKSIAELSEMLAMSAVDVAINLQLEGENGRRGGARLRGFSLSEYDVEAYAAKPWVVTATDGWIALPEDGLTHVRVYGTFPRKIAYYAMERNVLSVADAVRSSTSLPAQILSLQDRGMLRTGMKADLVVLNLAELRDNATLFEPHQFPSGIDYVLVNGHFVVERGEPTGRLAGELLDRAASRQQPAAGEPSARRRQ